MQIRMDKSIGNIRKELSIIDEIAREATVKSSRGRKTKRKYGIHNITHINDLNSIKETLKKKLLAKAQRRRRRRIGLRCKFFRQNRLFSTDTKKFYRELNEPGYKVKTPLPPFCCHVISKYQCVQHIVVKTSRCYIFSPVFCIFF